MEGGPRPCEPGPRAPAGLALDLDGRVGEALDDLLLLRGAVKAPSMSVTWMSGTLSSLWAGVAIAVMVRPTGAAHIGHIP